MEKIVINKEFLSGYKTLSIGFENCDDYKIDVADIVDVYCEVERIDGGRNEYRTRDGFIKISARASDVVETSVLQNEWVGTEWDCRLKERLEACGGGVDMPSFSLKDEEKRSIHIYVPYNPLEDVLRGNEIELSNCPSLEIDDDGNMVVAFGMSSKQPTRKDNNYAELVAGWKEAFGENEPEVLKAVVNSLLTFGDGQMNLSLGVALRDKLGGKDCVEFVFMDCQNVDMEMFFPESGECEIVMSKMMDGRIYVGFYGLHISFTCASVLEYEYYCKQLDEE